MIFSKTRVRLWAGATALLFGSSFALALEPPTREQIERYIRDGTLPARVAQARSYGNHRIPPRVAVQTRDRLRRLALDRRLFSKELLQTGVQSPPSAWVGMPTKGTVKVLALLIAFTDYPPSTPAETFTAKLFGDGSGGFPYESLRNYYRRASYNQLEIQGDVLGWYTAPYARSSVVETDAGRQNLIKEALTYYDQQGHDFSQYDNDGDGAIDYFCVFWTGPHGEWASFWWGYYTGFYDASFRVDGKRLAQYSWQWELYNYPSGSFSPTTIIHETGHALGLPDYYDYDDSVGPRGGVGGLDMMDATTGDHNCFSKFMLDWITPTVVAAGPQTVVLRASGTDGDALIFCPTAVDGQIFDEYFMVQNRTRTGNDSTLFTGTDGLLVWHVDARLNAWGTDFLYDNSFTEHKLLKLMEADGLEEIETFASMADSGDYYKAGMTFGPATVPNTSRYGGLGTGMGIWNITGTTTPMSLDVFSNDAAPSCSITSPVSYVQFGTIPVTVAASDDNGVVKVELYAESTLLATSTSPPFSFSLDTRTLANGEHQLRAVAYDTIMQTSVGTITAFIDNTYAPSSFKAERAINRGAILSENINVLTWSDNPQNLALSKYRIYATGPSGTALLAEIPYVGNATPYRYLDRHVTAGETITYIVVGVSSMRDAEGDPATASVR